MRGDPPIRDPPGMEVRTAGAPPPRLAGAGRAAAQLALTLALSLVGLWAAVSFAGSREGPIEPSARQLPGPHEPVPPGPELRQIDYMPPPAVIFIVGSEQARADLTRALELEAAIRAATHQPALDASVSVAETDAEAQAMKRATAATFHEGVVTRVDVIDLR